MKTILIAGLGNPGKKFEKTRHNAGFIFADYFRENSRDESGFSDWELKKKMKSEISVGKFNGKKIILAKPQTFMNLSGVAVTAAKKFYKVKLENIIVVHDEIDLPLGTHRFSIGSSSAGHKGVQNIIDVLGARNFSRLRIGVDNRGDKKIPTEKYVLGKLSQKEMNALEKVFTDSAKNLIEKISN